MQFIVAQNETNFVRTLQHVCLSSFRRVPPYRLLVGLVAVVAGGQVAHRADGEPAALSGIGVLLVAVVTQALEEAADDVLVVADVVGVLGDVVAIPGGQGGWRDDQESATVSEKKKNTRYPRVLCTYIRQHNYFNN